MLDVQGKDLGELTALHFDRPGFTPERTRPTRFRVSIPKDAEPGTIEIRTVGKHGISAARLFAVQDGLDEVAEKEPNDSAQPLTLPTVVCGRFGKPVTLRGDAQVPFSRDGKTKANVRVADPAVPVTVEVTAKK